MSKLTAITIHSIYVLDQEEALDFYVGKLGLEVDSDVDMGFMRWLTVAVPGAPGRSILLELAGPPSMSPDAAAQARELLTQGALPTAAFFTTDDAQGLHDRLVAAGVEITEAPTQQPYGIDFAARDPFGNHLRISQPTGVREITDADIARWAEGRG